MNKATENTWIDEVNGMRRDLERSQEMYRMKEGELERANIHLANVNAEIQASQSQLLDLSDAKEENISLKKNVLDVEKVNRAYEKRISELENQHQINNTESNSSIAAKNGQNQLTKMAAQATQTSPTNSNDRIQELEMLLETRTRMIEYLQEEHKKEVERALQAEEKTVSLINECKFLQRQISELPATRQKPIESKENATADQKFHDDYDSSNEEGITSEIASQKIERLECMVAVLEAEVSHLSSTIAQLEENLIALEKENGKLIAENLTNIALQTKVRQLQEDIGKDTKLRQNLIDKLNEGKTDLARKLTNLEACLQDEKIANSTMKESLIMQGNECKQLRVERHSLKVGLDTANMTIDRMEKEAESLKQQLQQQYHELHMSEKNANDTDANGIGLKIPALRFKEEELARKTAEAKEITVQLLNDRKTIAILEDRLRDLNFNLHQRNTDLVSIKTVSAARADGQEREISDLRGKCTSLHKEVEATSGQLASVAEERNCYRDQVHEMNIALKNSLEHIRQLRAKAKSTASLSQCTSPRSTSSQSTDGGLLSFTEEKGEADLAELLQRTSSSTPSAGKNLSHLQNCLASLKSEMAVLQSRLSTQATSSTGIQHLSDPVNV